MLRLLVLLSALLGFAFLALPLLALLFLHAKVGNVIVLFLLGLFFFQHYCPVSFEFIEELWLLTPNLHQLLEV